MTGDLRALWDWRRRVAALYAEIRAQEDPERAHAIWAETRRDLFATHDQSPIEAEQRAAYAGPHVYRYDPALRFCVPLVPVSAAALTLDAGADGALALIPFARTDGLATALGAELTLFWIATYGGGVFLPFRDATSGGETYGGGRYLLDTIKSADLGGTPDGRAILDFNFAYFPSCAYSDRYVCPLAPPQNRVRAPIRAGERLAAA